MTAPPTDMLALARDYYEAGLAVVPPKQNGEKRPYPSSWQQYQHIRPTPAEIREWYSHGLTGIGAVMGSVSGNLELFEFDSWAAYLAFCELATETGLGELIGRVRNAYEEHTPNGGIHWYYRCDTIAGNTKLASKLDGTAVKVLIETRGEGGYAVMAPSYGTVHPTGNAYEVVCGDVADIVTVTPEERQSLWQLARSFDELPQYNPRDTPQSPSDGDRPGDRYNATATWREVLEPHGWKRVYRKGETIYWRRPGKDTGISATTNHTGNNTLIVFSSSTMFTTAPASYSLFAAYTVLNHEGNYQAAGRTLWGDGYREDGTNASLGQKPPPLPADADPATGEDGPQELDMALFWATDHVAEDWLLEPILPRGRSISIYSPAGQGKSLFALDMLTRLALGRPCFDQPASDPVHIVYLDYEMSESDLKDRLDGMGYGPTNDWSHFHYYLLPDMPPLDTVKGAEALRAIVARHSAAIVAIDTTSRVISGEENDADTIRNLYSLSILPLKSQGVTVLRLDHAGKDLAKGQRGTSAKGDDLDLIWELTVRDDGVQLVAKKRRQLWIPESVNLQRLDDPTRHERVDESWPAGTQALADQMDTATISVFTTNKAARAALKMAGIAARGTLLAAAIRYRKIRETPRETPFENDPGNEGGKRWKRDAPELGNASGNAGNATPERTWETGGVTRRETPPLHAAEIAPNEDKEEPELWWNR